MFSVVDVSNITVSEITALFSDPLTPLMNLATSESIETYNLESNTILTFSLDKDFGQFDSIAMIPFAIDPLNYTQPSGCISNSESTNRIILESGTSNPNMLLYAVNYNILQISEGKSFIYRS